MRDGLSTLRWKRVSAGLFIGTILVAGCNDSTEPSTKPSTEPTRVLRIVATTDTSLTAAVATDVTPTPTVRVTDQSGRPAAGVPVLFKVTGGGVTTTSARTAADGVASVGTWTLGTRAGTSTVTAHADGLPDVVFTATATPRPAAQIKLVSGNYQKALVTAPLTSALQVRVADVFDNAVSGAPVTFTVISGDGTIDGSAVVTDSLGIATSRTWTLGSVQGIQQVKAEIGGGAQTVFTAIACNETCRQQLLFVRDEEIFATDLLSGEVKPLAAGREPAWSPDGRQIAFVRYDEHRTGSIYLMDADGSNVVLRAAGFHSPAWSPDGRSLAVARGECGIECEVYVLSATDDGTPPARLADRADDPAWSPDGATIAFVSRLREGDEGDALHVMNADGSEVRVIVPPELQPLQPNIDVDYMTHPTWSPDGRRIAFMKYSDPGGYRLFVVNSDGSGLVQLQLRPTTESAPFDPAWSPDGTMIAFTLRMYDDGSIGSYVAYVPADHGGEPIRIAPGFSPGWRPIVGNRE